MQNKYFKPDLKGQEDRECPNEEWEQQEIKEYDLIFSRK